MVDSLSRKLRARTESAHERAEQNEFVQLLFRGSIDRCRWSRFIVTLLAIHKQLAHSASTADWFEDVETLELARNRVADLQTDRGALNLRGPDSRIDLPLAALEFLDWLSSRATPHELLGVFYVMEGSSNGNRMLAEHLSAAGPSFCAKSHYLRGDDQHVTTKWQRTRLWFDELRLDAEAEHEALEGAAVAFEAMTRIYSALGLPSDT
jgi:heme oxygenase